MTNTWKAGWMVLALLVTTLVAVPAQAVPDPDPTNQSVWPNDNSPNLVPPSSGSTWTANFAGKAKTDPIYNADVRVIVSIRTRPAGNGGWTTIVDEEVMTVTHTSTTTQFKKWDFAGAATYTYTSGNEYQYKLWVQGKKTGDTVWTNCATYPLGTAWQQMQ